MRSNITDRWVKENGDRTARYGIGMRWRARYFDDVGKEYTEAG
jgi:O-methyltransferase involved in polyketide biosynthesis